MDKLQKQNLREHFLDQRNNLHKQPNFNVQNAAKQASQHITGYLKNMHGIWASYCPINTEFDPRIIESDNTHLTWAYPKIKKDLLEFRCFLGSQKTWQKNPFGINEPSVTSSKVIPLKKLQGIFCPALAIDLKGNRLGYGKGYYDRALSGFKGHKIALVFSTQISQQVLPTTDRDIPMKWILTEVDFWPCQP